MPLSSDVAHSVGSSSLELSRPHNTSFTTIERVLWHIQGHTKNLKELASQIEDPPAEIGTLIRDVEDYLTKPRRAMIAIIGPAGAGKSTLINALLGQRILMTSNSSAGTSTIIEVVYHSDQNPRAEIHYASREDWRNELEVLAADFKDTKDFGNSDQEDILNVTAVSRAKFKAAYPDFEREQFKQEDIDELMERNYVKEVLGETRAIGPTDSSAFLKELSHYLGSGRESSSMPAKWPLIMKVTVFVRAPILENGTMIVDLPGEDDNPARKRIMDNCLMDATHSFIVSPITRAADNPTVSRLLARSLHSELDGQKDSSVTMICTQTDVIDPRDDAESLGLSAELEELDRLQDNQDPSFETKKEELWARLISKRSTDTSFQLQRKFIDVCEGISGNQSASRRARRPPLVYCVSSRAYLSMKRISRADKIYGLPDEQSTDIPSLQNRLKDISIDYLAETSEQCWGTIANHVTSIHDWANGVSKAVLGPEGISLRQCLMHHEKETTHYVDGFLQEVEHEAYKKLMPILRTAELHAAEKAVSKVRSWAGLRSDGSPAHENSQAVRWNTYRATCRRNGIFKGACGYHNWPEELAEPVKTAMEEGWRNTFCGSFDSGLEKLETQLSESGDRVIQDACHIFHLAPNDPDLEELKKKKTQILPTSDQNYYPRC